MVYIFIYIGVALVQYSTVRDIYRMSGKRVYIFIGKITFRIVPIPWGIL